ncbi:MAG: PadR family transcriptional regulator [Halobacteriaceae archaeon]
MFDLTAFQRDLLYVVDGLDTPKGVDIKAELDTYYKEEINHGHLYPALEELSNKGLITKQELDGRTNMYSLTRRGRQEIEARREWEQSLIKDII